MQHMPRLNEYLSIGFCSGYGDADYSVKCSAADLSPAQVRDLRAIVPVAIAVLEKYLQEAIEKSIEPAAQAQEVSPSR
jgi:hypothetical protein